MIYPQSPSKRLSSGEQWGKELTGDIVPSQDGDTALHDGVIFPVWGILDLDPRK
jgi:hypothetical protein